jgi:rod shape-determining protein MreD
MTLARVTAAHASVLTALLLQATLVGPVTMSAQLSLPAVLVAAVALNCGAGSGISLGFGAGLVADLGSSHPAGILALCWLAVGVLCGLLADSTRSPRSQVLITGVVCGAAASVATLLLSAVGAAGATAEAAARGLLPAMAGDLLLALIVVPVVRWFLRSATLRAPATGNG